MFIKTNGPKYVSKFFFERASDRMANIFHSIIYRYLDQSKGDRVSTKYSTASDIP